jgi:hypothetical protein
MILEMRGREMRILVSSKHKYPAGIGGIGGGGVFDFKFPALAGHTIESSTVSQKGERP